MPPDDAVAAGLKIGESMLDALVNSLKLGVACHVDSQTAIDVEDLRNLLRSPADYGASDARGLSLYGALFNDRVVLDDLQLAFPIAFRNCIFQAGMSARSADLRRLDLTGSHLKHEYQEAFCAADCTVETDLSLDQCVARSSCVTGAIHLSGAEVQGELTFRGAKLSNDTGPALRAERIDVSGGVRLTKGFEAHGSGSDGAVRLSRSSLGAQLRARDASIINADGPALTAYDTRVGGVYLDGTFSAKGTGKKGTVRLVGVRADGLLTLRGSHLTNTSGPVLLADRINVAGDLFLDDAHLLGGSDMGAVRIFGGRVGGQLTARAAVIQNENGPGVNLLQSTIAGDTALDGAQVTGSGGGSLIDLSGTSVGGSFSILDIELTATAPASCWTLDGFTYAGLPTPSETVYWSNLLQRQTPAYRPQPYQQLINAYRAAGHEQDARVMLIEQRDDQVRRGGLLGREAAWAKFTKVALGYGWKPRRALYALLMILILSVAAALGLGQAGGLALDTTSTPRPPCAIVQLVEVGLRPANPIFNSATKAGDTCKPVLSSSAGQSLVVLSWALQLAAWATAALFIAGFTSAVRKV